MYNNRVINGAYLDSIDTKSNKRIIALDLMRGYFLIAIIADHVSWRPNLLFFFSGGTSLYASPAEGFFIISGTLVGYLYGHKILTNTLNVTSKLWKRAFKFYILSALFTFFFHACAMLLPEYRHPPFLKLWEGNISDLIISTLTLRFSYGWADFLPRYSVFMLFAPLALWLVAKGKVVILALFSFLIWNYLGRSDTLLQYTAWQLLFVIGIIIGYYLPSIKSRLIKLKTSTKKIIFNTLSLTALLTYLVSVFNFVLLPMLNYAPLIEVSNNIAKYFDKNTVAVGRVLLGLLWFSAMFININKYDLKINNFTKGVLYSIGSSSLLIYSVHAFVLFGITAIIYPINTSSVLLNTLFTLFTVVLIYWIVLVIKKIKLPNTAR